MSDDRTGEHAAPMPLVSLSLQVSHPAGPKHLYQEHRIPKGYRQFRLVAGLAQQVTSYSPTGQPLSGLQDLGVARYTVNQRLKGWEIGVAMLKRWGRHALRCPITDDGFWLGVAVQDLPPQVWRQFLIDAAIDCPDFFPLTELEKLPSGLISEGRLALPLTKSLSYPQWKPDSEGTTLLLWRRLVNEAPPYWDLPRFTSTQERAAQARPGPGQ